MLTNDWKARILWKCLENSIALLTRKVQAVKSHWKTNTLWSYFCSSQSMRKGCLPVCNQGNKFSSCLTGPMISQSAFCLDNWMKYLGQLNEASNATVRSLMALSQRAFDCPCHVLSLQRWTWPSWFYFLRLCWNRRSSSFNNPLTGVGVLVKIDLNLTW